MSKIIKIGLIGCGNICRAYLNAAKSFDIMEITACSDIKLSASKIIASEYGIKTISVENLINDRSIDIILNLTTPQSHAEVNTMALKSGKHVHCEKPFALRADEGRKVLELAKTQNLMIGCAPDTFLGGGIQTCRKLIDDGWIGRPVAGTAFMMCHGHESWHPNPFFYYAKGGGPLFDMGPYYITALVNLLGPVKRVSASAAMPFPKRTATCKEHAGKSIKVEVSTHLAGTLDFENGAVVSLIMSFDVWKHGGAPIEIHGETGSIQVPDPNCFGGPVKLFKPGYKDYQWQDFPLSHGYTDNMRSIGLADMAYAIKYKRQNRCSGELGYHVLEVMQSFEISSDTGRHVTIKSTVKKPAALPIGLRNGLLDK